ncbi:hypothetical protein pb186bvf_002697 [Paramecium bursaria]
MLLIGAKNKVFIAKNYFSIFINQIKKIMKMYNQNQLSQDDLIPLSFISDDQPEEEIEQFDNHSNRLDQQNNQGDHQQNQPSSDNQKHLQTQNLQGPQKYNDDDDQNDRYLTYNYPTKNSQQIDVQNQQSPVYEIQEQNDPHSTIEQISPLSQQHNNFQSTVQPEQFRQQKQQEKHEQQEFHQSNLQHEQHRQQVQKQQQIQKKTRKIKKPIKSNQIQRQNGIEQNDAQLNQQNPKQKSKSKSKQITEKHLKIQKRIEQRNINERLVNEKYEEKIKQYFEKYPYFKLPYEINQETINQIIQNISKIKDQIYKEFCQKIEETQYKEEMLYIMQIMMLIVKDIIYTKIGRNPNIYMLKEIQWINKMKDDLQYALLKPKVQKALGYIYRFILNNENGQQSNEKIEWKDLTQNKEYLGYQLEYGKNFFTSLGRNYWLYINNPKTKKDDPQLDKNLYDLGAQLNTYIKKTEFFCEKYDRSGIKYFVVNYYMEYFLKNRYNVTKRIEEIYLDDLINLIISIF